MKKLLKYFLDLKSFKLISIDLIRIYVGLGLAIKGIMFMFEPKELSDWMVQGNLIFLDAMLAHYVVVAHLVGGCLLIFGLLTRVAALIQVPVLLGAIIFVHIQEGLINNQNLQFTGLLLFILIVISIAENGPLSIGFYLKKEE